MAWGGGVNQLGLSRSNGIEAAGSAGHVRVADCFCRGYTPWNDPTGSMTRPDLTTHEVTRPDLFTH